MKHITYTNVRLVIFSKKSLLDKNRQFGTNFIRDIEIQGWFPAGSVLPHEPLWPFLATLLMTVSQKKKLLEYIFCYINLPRTLRQIWMTS